MPESTDLKNKKIRAGHRSYATRLIADVKCLEEPYVTDDLEHVCRTTHLSD